MDYKELVSGADLATRELLFIYELSKMGAIRFDMNILEHENTIKGLALQIESLKQTDTTRMCGFERIELENRINMWTLILFYILKYAVPKCQ